MIFTDISNKIKRINVYTIYQEAFSNKSLQQWVSLTIQKRLYNIGETGSSTKLVTDKGQPYYSPVTVSIKKKKGQKTSNVTLKDTGRFYDSIRMNLINYGFEVSAVFLKTRGHMFKNFTNLYPSRAAFEQDILSLTDAEIKFMVEKYIIPDIIKRIHEAI